MAKIRYTKDQLEHLVGVQLENIERYQDLIALLREQNNLIEEMNRAVAMRLDLFTGAMKLYPHTSNQKRDALGDALTGLRNLLNER